MVPTPIRLTRSAAAVPHAASSRLIVLLYSLASRYVSTYLDRPVHTTDPHLNAGLVKRSKIEKHDTKFIVFACLIPMLVLLSGIFAGLTLGYMSLDETQLNVLSISGTP
jgi:metal transporter CNNM